MVRFVKGDKVTICFKRSKAAEILNGHQGTIKQAKYWDYEKRGAYRDHNEEVYNVEVAGAVVTYSGIWGDELEKIT